MQNKGLVIGCFAIVLAACGWMLFAPASGGGDSKAKIEKTVESYLQAFARGDGKKACEHLTEGARDAVAGLSGRVGAKGCADAFERTRELGGPEVVRAASRIKVGKVRIDGSTASVELRAGSQDTLAQLEHVGDGWKISSLPKS